MKHQCKIIFKSNTSGFGLLGMRERTIAAGGKFTIYITHQMRACRFTSIDRLTAQIKRGELMTADCINGTITVMLIDDHPVVRAGNRRLLESTSDINIEVVAEASDGKTGCLLCQKNKPDVVILDLNLADGIDGFETIRRIKAKNPNAHILIFSMHNHQTMVQRALKTGATGYITKQCGMNQMVQAIRLVKQGKIYIDPDIASNMAANLTLNDAIEDPLNILTEREFQIFKLMAEGNSCAQIAEMISISPKTVGVHHANIMKKLKLQNIAQLVRLAINCNVTQV